MAKRLDVFVEFKDDHRKVRDMLFELRAKIEQHDVKGARGVLGRLDAFVGPHFRYEEEALYPALRPILEDYVDHMLEAHDGAIATARQLAALLQKDRLTSEDAKVGKKGVLEILPHVSDCDGLSVFMESIQKLRPAEIDNIGRKIEECRKAGVPLLKWAETVRERRTQHSCVCSN